MATCVNPGVLGVRILRAQGQMGSEHALLTSIHRVQQKSLNNKPWAPPQFSHLACPDFAIHRFSINNELILSGDLLQIKLPFLFSKDGCPISVLVPGSDKPQYKPQS